MTQNKLSEALIKYKEIHNLNNSQLARIAGIGCSQIGRLIKGDQKPTPRTIHTISTHLDIPTKELI